MREILYEDNTFTLSCEVVLENAFLHCTVDKWSHQAFKKGLVQFTRALRTLSARGFENAYCAIGNKKFAELAAGEFVRDIKQNGKVLGVYKWATR